MSKTQDLSLILDLLSTAEAVPLPKKEPFPLLSLMPRATSNRLLATSKLKTED
jgi:hypothetical protein